MATSATAEGFPAFARDIDATLAVHAHYVLWGNVRDLFFIPGESGNLAPANLLDLIWRLLSNAGFQAVIVFDPIDGVRVLPGSDEARQLVESILGEYFDTNDRTPLAQLRGILEQVQSSQARVAVIIDYASRLVPDAEHLEPDELAFFRFCEKASQTSMPRRVEGAPRARLMNAVMWILDRDRDLPAWFTAGNEAVRIVPISTPALRERIRAARAIADQVQDIAQMAPDDRAVLIDKFAGAADGLTTRGMLDVVKLAHDRGIGFDAIDDAVRAYRVGMVDNPWRDDGLSDRVRENEASLGERVLGQGVAVDAALDVLKRSVLGMTAAQSSSGAARPRGVLFFAGPTGVGKTELAKCIAELAFGDRNAYLRFDMSEFSAEHSDARLIGAPPGYTGFDAGGELTNGVREQPFRLLLFDEIEKAHPRILDKFLQILDDGRLTDGRGSTVFFSETFIVFTSNLGIYVPVSDQGRVKWVPNPAVRSGMAYEDLQRSIREAISNHFTETLNRPELLNRIGQENLVVFDFIHSDVALRIFELRLRELLNGIREELSLEIELIPSVTDDLRQRCTIELSNGGRGIENQLRAQFVNPLSRALFALDPLPPRIRVTGLAPAGAPPQVTIS